VKANALLGTRISVLVGCLLMTQGFSSAARPQTWIELRSTHFIVVSNAKEKEARQVGYQFELIRAVFRDYFRQSGSAAERYTQPKFIEMGFRLVVLEIKQLIPGVRRYMPAFGTRDI
jgi:hypothetical protein